MLIYYGLHTARMTRGKVAFCDPIFDCSAQKNAVRIFVWTRLEKRACPSIPDTAQNVLLKF